MRLLVQLLSLLTLLILTSCDDQLLSSENSEEPETNSITIFTGENGVVAPSGLIEVELDSSITLKATADEHYQFEKWIQVGVDEIEGLDSLNTVVTLSNLPSSSIALKASFVPQKCTLVVTPSDSARTLTPEDTIVVSYGDKVSITTEAKDGFVFDHWKLSDVNIISTSSIVDNALVVTVYGCGSIQPLFRQESTELELCTLVVASSDSADLITPEDTVIVPYGNKVSISTKASIGYAFEKWKLSDVNSLFVSSLVEESVVVTMLGSGTIKPLFQALNHDVVIDSVENGTINHVGTFSLSEEDSLEIIATANEHYHFVRWKQVGETTVPIDDVTSPKTFIKGVLGNGRVEAVFERRIITALYSSPLLAVSGHSTMLIDLFDERGNDLQITEGDSLLIHVKDAATTYTPIGIRVGMTAGTAGEVATIQELCSAIQAVIRDPQNGPGIEGAALTVNASGQLNIALGGSALSSMSVSNKSNPISSVYVQNLLFWSGEITGAVNNCDGYCYRPASKYDPIYEVYDNQGRHLGLEGGDEITVSGVFDDEKLHNAFTSFIMKDHMDWPQQTMQDLVDRIQSRMDDAMGGYFNVAINEDDPDFPMGAILIIPSETNILTFSDITMSANNSNNNSIAPSAFNQTMEFTYIYEDEE